MELITQKLMLIVNKPFYLLLALSFLIYLWYTFAIVYHFIRFGVGVRTKRLVFIFFTGSFFLFLAAVYAFSQINWQGILLFNF